MIRARLQHPRVEKSESVLVEAHPQGESRQRELLLRPVRGAADETRPQSSKSVEAIEEHTRRHNRRARVAELREMRVAGHDGLGIGGPGQGDEIVIPWIWRRAGLCLRVSSGDPFFVERA